MTDFINSISTLGLLVGTVIVNQLISVLRTWLSKRKMTKDVAEIKKQVSPNGGASFNDSVATGIKDLKAGQEIAKALLESYFAMLLNSENTALFRADEEGHWTFCNEKCSDVFGMYVKDMLGRGWETAVGKDQRERNDFMASYFDFFKSKRPLNEIVTIINQETKIATVYNVTAKQFIGNKIFLFNLGEIKKTQD